MKDKQNLYKKRGVDYEIPRAMLALPRDYFQSEVIYCQELETIFYKRWLMACREEEIPAPGDFLVVPVGDESIILVHDEQGRIQAHFNVCRHRGTRICTTEKGHFASGFFQCPYHAWQYDLTGHLRAAPLMKGVPGFRKTDYNLFSAHVGVWGGFVFINLAEEPAPFEEEMGALINRFEDWHLPELRIAHKIEYTLNCNWKLILQNYQECYHCPGVHPLLSKRTPFRSAVHDCFEGAVVGGYMEISEKRGSLTMDGKAAAPPVCEVSGDDLQRVHYYSVFPNLLLSPHPDFVLYHRLRPVTFDKTQIDCFFLLHPDIIREPKLMDRFQSAIEFWDMTNRQDWQVCEQMQLGLKSHRFKRGLYVSQEDISYALDKEVLKALEHKPPQ
jgi:Rieske 2Fe-2S family protein